MKKNKLIFLLLGCVILWSCTQPTDTTNIITQDDTVIKLDTPKIEGIVYPGVNYIYWSNVQNAIRPDITEKAQRRKIEELETKLKKKNEVIAEIAEESMMIKKTLEQRQIRKISFNAEN